jgi:hypothetical protein
MLVERKEHREVDGNIGYVESVFASENVLKTTFFPKSQRLYIAFSRGHTYSYGNVTSEMYEEFENCDSQGKYFHKNINNNQKHPVRKEFTLYPNEINELKLIVEEHKNEEEDEDGEDD